MFRVGDEVVCVDAGPCSPWEIACPSKGHNATGLKVGETYTIAAFGVWPGDHVTPVVFLNETTNDNGGEDVGFLPRRFRKVQRRDLQAWLSTAVPAPHLDKRPKTRVPA